MQMRKARPVILVGPLPPPYHGQSVAFEMLVGGCADRGVPNLVVDIAHGERSTSRLGQATWHRAVEYVRILSHYVRAILQPRTVVYLTIAQSTHGFARDFVMIWLARLLGHRVVCHLHGGNYRAFYDEQARWLQVLIRATLRRADSILILGERLRDAFGFDPQLRPKLQVVPNGLPVRNFQLPPPKRLPARPSPETPVRVLFLSNLVESKGYLDLLEALRLVRERPFGRAIVALFCGKFMANPADDCRVRDAEHGRRLFDELIERYGLSDQVSYLGPVTGEAKWSVLRDAHIFVLPTYYNNEGQPVSIIEAMAFGNVVISTPYRAIPDLVEDGSTGLLVPPRDPASLADALSALIEDPERYARMSARAIRRFAERFTWEAHVDTLLSHLGHQSRSHTRSSRDRDVPDPIPQGHRLGHVSRDWT